MSEKPILFSTPMVQAIMDNRKNKTRRIMKRKGYDEAINKPENDFAQRSYENLWQIGHRMSNRVAPQNSIGVTCPYQVGEIRWIQETWKIDSVDDIHYTMAIDFKAIQDGHNGAEVICKFSLERYHKFRKFYQKNGWQSPYFMPSEAARTRIRIIGAVPERLQDITEEEAKAEGIKGYTKDGQLYKYCVNVDEWIKNWKDKSQTSWQGMPRTAKEAFKMLWDSLHKNDGHDWEKNDWVWNVSFEKVIP